MNDGATLNSGKWKHSPKVNAKMASGVAVATFLTFFVLLFQNILFNNHGMVSEAKLMTEHSASAAFTLKVLYW